MQQPCQRAAKDQVERVEIAKEKLRELAQVAFLAAGGARVVFAREWLSVFLEEVRGVGVRNKATLLRAA
jgi:predicted Zn-dependent protease